MKKTIIDNSYEFKEVDELLGCKDFREFEEENDDLIIYADMDAKSVINALVEPIDLGTDMTTKNVYRRLSLWLFDGWFIALK